MERLVHIGPPPPNLLCEPSLSNLTYHTHCQIPHTLNYFNMSSPTTHPVDAEWHTPQTSRVKTLRNDAGMSYRQIWSATKIPLATAWRLNHGSSARRSANRTDFGETRGSKKKLSREEVARCDQLLETAGFDGKSLTWEMLAYECNLDCSAKTLKREMHHLDWWKCIACRKSWTSPSHVKRRVEWAQDALFLRPNPEDWDNVRFSDEMHTGFGPQGRVYVTRKPGTRTCASCIQHVAPEPKRERDQKRKHVWAAIGYNFKSDLVFYEVPGNTNGKLTLQVYRDKILEPVVKPWILESRANGTVFTLEEDGDSGHGTGKNNICRTWKKDNLLDCYFNVSGSPDLAPIENCWQGPKQWAKKVPHWDDETTEHLMVEGWEEHMPQRFINARSRSMPERLRDVLRLEGQMTGY